MFGDQSFALVQEGSLKLMSMEAAPLLCPYFLNLACYIYISAAGTGSTSI